MIWLTDNDVILKLACCDLLDETVCALNSTHEEIHVLNTARHVLLRPLANPQQARGRLGEAVFDRLTAFLHRATVITEAPSHDELRMFDDIVGIDAGEAILFTLGGQASDAFVVTGDKKSLRALHEDARCSKTCENLSGKILCFEQVILQVIESAGFEAVLHRVVPAVNCDTALRAAFGSGLEATAENVSTTLESYVRDLRCETGCLLCDQFG